MPIALTPRNVMSTGNLSPVVPIVTNNPAFTVKIMPLDGRMEQQSSPQQDTTQDDIKIGDWISGEELSNMQKSGNKKSGKILIINKSNQEIISYKILTKNGEEVLIDPTTAIKKNYGNANSFAAANEMRVLTYSNWLIENKKSV